MIITISGLPGSGKDTVGKIVASKLGMKFYSMGDLYGELAKKHGMKLDEILETAKKEDWPDKEIDKNIINMGNSEDNFIIVSRVAFHFIPHSIKVFLGVDYKEAARRIIADQVGRGDEKIANNINEEAEILKQRAEGDGKRYMKYYNIDYLDKKNFDLWIDTTSITAIHVADNIIKFIKSYMASAIKKEIEKQNDNDQNDEKRMF